MTHLESYPPVFCPEEAANLRYLYLIRMFHFANDTWYLQRSR